VARKNKGSRLVYSTDQGKMCPGCERPVGECECRREAPAPKGDGVVRVSRETKGRKGKGVTLVTGLALDADALAQLAGQLRAKCGAGGAVKNGVIEIQGDHRDRLVQKLTQLGHPAKRAGG
jgi:translation initiation factor 1